MYLKTNMKLLYLSVHSILEYDELKIFEELGIDYFSLGSYINPQQPVDPIRPALKKAPDEWLLTHAPLRDKLTKEFVNKFDVIVIMHGDTGDGNWIEQNWPVLQGKRVIWRTIGQSTSKLEQKMFTYRTQGLQVVRYSRREANIDQTAGCDRIIPFYKDPEEFNNWIGAGNQVITIAQNMKVRAEYCNYDTFCYLAKGFNAKLYGPHNENSEYNGGLLTYEEMKQKMRDCRVYIYTGTQPASYTLNLIEAMMTGAPIVAIGPKYANSLKIAGDTYEIPDIITNGVNGFWSDDMDELRGRIEFLLSDLAAARRIGAMGRETAIQRFGKQTVKMLWEQFLTKG